MPRPYRKPRTQQSPPRIPTLSQQLPQSTVLLQVNCASLRTYTFLMGGSSAGIHCSVFIAAQ